MIRIRMQRAVLVGAGVMIFAAGAGGQAALADVQAAFAGGQAALAAGAARADGGGAVGTGRAAVGAGRAAVGAGPASAAGAWGKPVILAGAGGPIASLDCAAPGNCAAGGATSTGVNSTLPFVASQLRGAWGKASVVPGTTAPKGWKNVAWVSAVSCPADGDCVAVGTYKGESLKLQGFIDTERGGKWGRPLAVPGLARLDDNRGPGTMAISIDCPSTGNCSATGTYTNGDDLPFVVSEVRGKWGQAEEVPGLAALPGITVGGSVYAYSGLVLSCPGNGNCTAAGAYPFDGSIGNHQAYTVSEVHGRWGNAAALPGMAALNTGMLADVSSISCATPGNCALGGDYWTADESNHSFVASEASGTWSPAIEVPGTAGVNSPGGAGVGSVSCPANGTCTATGAYGNGQPYLLTETSGTWGSAKPVPGLALLDKHRTASLATISCPTAGNCTTGGSYNPARRVNQVFVISQVNGVWQSAIEIPGTGALNTRNRASVSAISCAAPGKCSLAGQLTSKKNGTETFLVTRS